MRRDPRNLMWLAPLLLFATSFLWWPSVRDFLAPRGGYNPKLIQARPAESPVENFRMEQVDITMASNGRDEWRIHAKRAFSDEKNDRIRLEEVDARYIVQGKDPVTITSRKGLYVLDEKRLILTGQARVVKPAKDEVLLSERLEYDDKDRALVSPGEVTILTKDLRLKAGKLRYDLEKGAYRFDQRVKVDL
ncbi:MAG: LPS export ABC transporter periplasmic protein LptC [Desulfobulbus sp.]|jgi:LPS export ABC transporter protein LptC